MKGRREQGGDSIAQKLRRLLVNCPVCYTAGFAGHSYTNFASVRAVEEDKEQIQEFLQAAEKNQWERLKEFQGFRVQFDGLIAYALRCPSGRAAIVIIRDPYELWEDDELLRWRRVEGRGVDSLVALTDPADWKPLETEAPVRR